MAFILPVYVDGSFWQSRSAPRMDFGCDCRTRAGYGVYFPTLNTEFFGRAPYYVETNNDAELYAIIRAIRFRQNTNARLRIFTDSFYSIRITREYDDWLEDWDDYSILHQELFESMDSLTHLPEFIHVRAHSGNHGNDTAHSLARAGMRESCGRFWCA